MPLPVPFATDLRQAGLPLLEDEPLHKRAWWRVGGPADGFVTLTDPGQVAFVQRACAAAGVPLTVLGNGSNVLVSDAGVRGLVVQMAGSLADAAVDGTTLLVGAGLKLTVLLNRAAKHGWTGLDPFVGIPGTIGGAVRMNAGTTLGETGDRLDAVELCLPDGSTGFVDPATLALGYRTCHLPGGALITRARLRLSDEPYAEAEPRLRAFLDRRKATQPLDQPSCGSTFTNPPGDAAGRLIEAAGLKGHQIGGARISEKHANFFLNTGEATAADLDALIRHAIDVVRDRFGVALHPEVVKVGDWDHSSGAR